MDDEKADSPPKVRLKEPYFADVDYETRDYQMEMANEATKRNTIVYLPTGAGKTFISIMVLKSFHSEIEKPWLEGGKKIIFTAPKVALVDQQAEVLRKHTPFSVRAYNGYMQVEFWDQEKWNQEFSQNQVLVMGAQVLSDMLDKRYISLDRIALLIFDECHHATGNHPMNMIMKTHYKRDGTVKMPRILGLTATLIKRNVKLGSIDKEVNTLEMNLDSQLAQLNSVDVIKGMYADPTIELVECAPVEHPPLINSVMLLVKRLQNDIKTEMDIIKRDNYLQIKQNKDSKLESVAPGELLSKPGSLCKRINRQLSDILLEIDTFGLFGGNLAVQCHRNSLQTWANITDVEKHRRIFSMAVSQLEVIRHLIEASMIRHNKNIAEQILHFSSPKVKACLEQLREMKDKEDLRCIIFVERRVTAKILCTVIKLMSLHDADFKKVKPDYAVGQGDGGYNSRMGLLAEKMTRICIARFAAGETNLIVASSVMEEGIDIPACNVVIKFDEVKSFCSFIQSKGRARAKDAKYIVLQVMRPHFPGYKEAKESFAKIEDKLQNLHLFVEMDQKEQDDYSVSAYTTPAGAIATIDTAINILYKYCLTLEGDRFSTSLPTWYCKKLDDGGLFVSVLLPLSSTFPDAIKGPVVRSLRRAKSACALEAIKLLHQKGQLDDHLRSVMHSKKSASVDPSLFPCWVADDTADKDSGAPGTKTRRRLHGIKIPSAMTDAAPKAGKLVYVHLIKIIPQYSVPDGEQRRQTFLDLLKSPVENFAILTSKPWPKLCTFPVFTNPGEIKVDIQVNCKIVTLNEEEMQNLHHFHTFLFASVLNLDKSFIARNFSTGINDYIIAPVCKAGNIKWDLLEKDFSKKYEQEVITDFSNLLLKVIRPTYRSKFIGNYIVTEVQAESNPMTEFPNQEYGSYVDYYKERWHAEINNFEQPLVNVKQITDNINFLNPRGQIVLVTRKAMHENDEFAEVFVPELCHLSGNNHVVTAEMWLKAIFLPSILQRSTILLNAEDLRTAINKECQIGSDEVSEWNEFVAHSQRTDQAITQKPKAQGFGLPKFTCKVPNVNELYCPWNEEDPLDPDSFLHEGVTWGQLEEYSTFASKPLVLDDVLNVQQDSTLSQERDLSITTVPISMLSPTEENLRVGPQLSTLYAAITTMSANDSVNMERLETLGDSYLKYITSLYLFCSYDSMEGILTNAKGKLVGNRNLYYCAVNRGIPNLLNHKPFAPKSDWKVPNFFVPDALKQLINSSEINPGVLAKIELSEEEKASGCLGDLDYIMNVFLEYEEDESTETTMVSFLDLQLIPDKCVADSVEAVIGAYVESCGPVKSAALISWLKILPESVVDVVSSPPASNIRNPNAENVESTVDMLLCQAGKLEEVLGYKFKNRSILLEALSHPSYIANRLTYSNQRLEFLGDAVLDFLITAHINEQFTYLTPGEVTDLRSALVNNVTFASLAVRYGFHTYILHTSPAILSVIDNFVDFQQKNKHSISEEYLMLLQEDSIALGFAVDVPKLLGDIFESIAGAVFLDSGKDLARTWEVFYPLMQKEIDAFGRNVPKNPVRLLHESVDAHDLEFGKPHKIEDVDGIVIKIVMRKDGKTYSCYGSGVNKHHAKKAAAKCALRMLLHI